ncbi:MAG: glycosyltransferase family 39 protein [Candidatus Omnitrophica bacterium]|nr:glycosyltransferase family 39 protein [Candidatus Omnitrophota bacterium]
MKSLISSQKNKSFLLLLFAVIVAGLLCWIYLGFLTDGSVKSSLLQSLLEAVLFLGYFFKNFSSIGFFIVFVYFFRTPLSEIGESLERRAQTLAAHSKVFMIILCLIFMTLLSFYAVSILECFPNSADEYAYLFQAQTYQEGRLWNPLHPKHDFFNFDYIYGKDGKWVSNYLPGWPLLLTAGMILKIPLCLINPILGTLSLIVLFLTARRLYGRGIAVVSVLLFAFSPFFIFNSASYFTHTLCALLILLASFLTRTYLDQPKKRYALLSGIFMGWAAITRSYTAALCLWPLLIYAVLKKKKEAIPYLVLTFMGAAPLLLLNFYFNYRITGNPFLYPVHWYYPDFKIFGFDEAYPWQRALSKTCFWFELLVFWSGPSILFVYIYFLAAAVLKQRPLSINDLIFLSLIIGYAWFRDFGGNQYGPRYYYEAYPFLVLSVTSKLLGPGGDLGNIKMKNFLISILALGFLFNLAVLPVITRLEHQAIVERQDVYQQVKEHQIKNAVVFLKSGTGVLKPMPPEDLTRNGIHLTGDVLYALDHGPRNRELKPYFPSRKFYRYSRAPRDPHGTIEEIAL